MNIYESVIKRDLPFKQQIAISAVFGVAWGFGMGLVLGFMAVLMVLMAKVRP